MLSPQDFDELDRAVERLLVSGARGEIRLIGAGEMTCVLEWRGHACKRLPPFTDQSRIDGYARLLEEYLARLRDCGVAVLDTRLHVVSRGGAHMVYLAQPLIPADHCLPAWIRSATQADGIAMVRLVMDHVRRCTAKGVGIDANLSNWSVRDGQPLYFDVSTPMLRDADGRHRLDTEIFVATLPAMVRGLVRRYFVTELLDRYFDARTVYENLIGDLPNTRLDDLTMPLLAEANARLDRPLTLKQIEAYRREDWLTWRAIRQLLKLEQFWRRTILRAPNPHLLPSQFKGD
jgi:hypothetical protein